ncbi:hypothetical protein [Euzebya sp.]|uniref:hypothetical protein n=1 Tax=Euzebya sp. TaxID=1971409 RepID=UPI00351272A3
MGKEEIAGLVAAVRRYVTLDHEAERRGWYEVVEQWRTHLQGLPGVAVSVDQRNEAGQPVPRLSVVIDPAVVGRTAEDVVFALMQGEPSIAVLADGRDGLYISPDMLQPGDDEVVRERLLSLINARP